ncbi:hypothetical protein BJY52DRAFT_1225278 [Lactarius psammicola]|nr:hypothetical protein BJY52DRAFT_1227722 [Lactarius psammicola]KAI9454033.1 hypothetical protein BJY52DRAFT_1225278 [Lactarius psammicola]
MYYAFPKVTQTCELLRRSCAAPRRNRAGEGLTCWDVLECSLARSECAELVLDECPCGTSADEREGYKNSISCNEILPDRTGSFRSARAWWVVAWSYLPATRRRRARLWAGGDGGAGGMVGANLGRGRCQRRSRSGIWTVLSWLTEGNRGCLREGEYSWPSLGQRREIAKAGVWAVRPYFGTITMRFERMTNCEAKGRANYRSGKGGLELGFCLPQSTGCDFCNQGVGKGVGGGLYFAGFLEFLDLPARLSREFRGSEEAIKAHICECPFENKKIHQR